MALASGSLTKCGAFQHGVPEEACYFFRETDSVAGKGGVVEIVLWRTVRYQWLAVNTAQDYLAGK